MQALILTAYGKAGALALAEVARPTVAPGEILVRVHAAGINPVDNAIVKGEFKPLLKFALPAVMGSDLAGVVVEVGAGVTRFKVGDAVFASVFDTGRGALAELVAVPEQMAAHKPANLDFVQAASIPMVGLTAWQAFHEHAPVKPGQKVFIPAGSGGIGTFAIQLAKQLGAHVATTTSTGNVALVRSLGADDIIDYTQQQFTEVLQGYDTVLGTVRGDGLEQALHIVRPGSHVVSLIGPPTAEFARKRGMNLVFRFVMGLLSRKIKGLAKRRGAHYSFMFIRPDGAQLAQIGQLLAAGRIRPVIDRVFPLVQAQDALAYLAQGRARGKVVVRMVEQ
jgi:NADPH:quinone reductase-like Zn-dependent oxidoreductase